MQKRNRSNILGFLFGLFVLLLGLGAWGLGGQINRLTCIRLKNAETECRIERRLFGLLLLREQRLQGVSGAALISFEKIVRMVAATGLNSSLRPALFG